MDKAVQRALEKYPKRKDGQTRGYVCDDNDIRRIYSQGYRQAEKDLALTLEDMKDVIAAEGSIYDENNGNSEEVFAAYPTEEAFYEEVLRRFNEQREK